MPPPSPCKMGFRSRLHVDLSILEQNYKKLKNICSKNEVVFMVKADAYGHGLLPIVNFAHRQLGVNEFGCATLAEAISLREEFVDCQFEVYVFSDVQLHLEESAALYLNRRILPVISNLEDLSFILSNPDFKHLPLCLKFNTGMNRLGLPCEKTEEIVERIKRAGRNTIHHLMTHFACASQPMDSNRRNLYQRESFAQIKRFFIDSGLLLEKTSISNSGAIEQKVGLDESHIRPGLMLYGPSSLLERYADKSCWDGRIISSLETYVLNVFPVKRGQPIGYGASPCPSDGVIAVLALGYGDGFSTHYGGVQLAYKELNGQVFGRINMDMLQVFFKEQTALEKIHAGKSFIIWNHDPEGLTSFCAQTKTIAYEVFCNLSGRVPRIYKTD